MPLHYLPVDQARTHPGLRMVVVPNVPSPWGEAAKGFFHIKNIEWHAVRLVHEICGEEGLGWTRWLQLVHAGLQGAPGFPAPVAKYLAKKYGYRSAAAGGYGTRVTRLLGMLATQLKYQREQNIHYYVGNSPTAADVYSATFIALFKNLEDGAEVSQFVEWFPGVTAEHVRAVLEHAARSALAPA